MAEKPPAAWLDANEIKRDVSIEQVLAHYGALDRMQRRGNTLRGLSPFREEKNPSFSARTDRGVWSDHGGRPVIDGEEVKGNVIGLVMAFEQCSFREALEKCDQLRGGSATPPRPRTAPETAADTRDQVQHVLDRPGLVNEVFGKELRGLRYDAPLLKERGLSPDRAKYWGIGYCSRGLMKSRIVVPIKNRDRQVVAYVGRSLKDDDPRGKWSFPGGFHKSLELFNIHNIANDEETRAAVEKYGIIVTEGVFDCIHLVENGFKNAVASLGAEASARQCELLIDPKLNPTRRVTIFYDADEAGRKGRRRLCAELIYRAWVRYVELDRIDFADRTDPDECTKEELQALLGVRL